MDYKHKTTNEVVTAVKTEAPCEHAGLSVEEGFWILTKGGKDIPVAMRDEKFLSEYEPVLLKSEPIVKSKITDEPNG